MGTKEFGQLADAARRQHGYSLARVAVGVGVLPDGGVLNETQVKRILEGRRALDTFLVERLIAVLGLDRADAWEAALESADLKPPGLTADMLRRLDLVATGSREVMPGNVRSLPDRRRRDRRRTPRHLKLVA